MLKIEIWNPIAKRSKIIEYVTVHTSDKEEAKKIMYEKAQLFVTATQCEEAKWRFSGSSEDHFVISSLHGELNQNLVRQPI